MRYRAFIFLCVLMLTLASPILANDNSLELTGYVRNYTGVLSDREQDYSIVQNTFSINFSQTKDKVYFKVNPYLYHYFDNRLDIGLRQAYMDIHFDSMDIRVGKQQIIWGKADGVFITDIISPKDMSEFLLPDFEEIRIGINSVKADYYFGNNTFEAVWVPVFTPTQMPEDNSIWKITPSFPANPSFDFSQKEVERKIKNSEIFAKYSMLTSLLDFEVMTGYMWDDDPTLYATKTIDPDTNQLASVIVTPRHHRLGVAGGSLSTTQAGIVFRGEGAYYDGKRFTSLNPLYPKGVVEKNYIHYLLGIDYALWDIRLSAQFIQQVILDYEPQIDNDEFDNTLTFLISRNFLREILHTELFSYVGFNDGDALIRPRIIYDLADGFKITLGANIFIGNEGKFGQYNDNDMIYTKVQYSF